MQKVLTAKSLEDALEECRQQLQALECAASEQDLIRRLQRQSPRHPMLLIWRSMHWVAIALVVASGTVLMLPFHSPEMARSLMIFESMLGMNVPAILAVLTIVAVLVGQASRCLAIRRGESCRLLPHEFRKRLRIENESIRLKTVLALRKRTATPAIHAKRMCVTK